MGQVLLRAFSELLGVLGVYGIANAPTAGLAGGLRGVFRLVPMVIWSSKTPTSCRAGACGPA
jgi:hypothetical protein